MKRKLVWVRWRDSSIVPTGYLNSGDVPDSLTVYESTGFLVYLDGNALTLAIDWEDEGQRWRGIVGIPVESILKKKVISIDV